MNQVRSVQKLSERELEVGILRPEESWHHEHKDQAYIYFGGLDYELTEADVLTIFSQYGSPVDIKLVRDRETGESKGFGYLKFEDQRSTILAVDNLNGSKVCGRIMRVDHTFFKPRTEDEEYSKAVRRELGKDFANINISQESEEREGSSETQKHVYPPKEELGGDRPKKEEFSWKAEDDELEDPMTNFFKN